MGKVGAVNIDVIVGSEIPDPDVISFVVERDMFQPDMAVIVVSNQNDQYSSKVTIGSAVEIKAKGASIYKGEVVGLEASYKANETTKLIIRAMNGLHKLLRKRVSKTYTDKNDQAILNEVVSAAGLTLEFKHEKPLTHKHVYQHNQTGLEFLRMRAARLGCHVWCVDKKVFVKEPELDKTGPVELSVDESGNLRNFTPRLQTVNVVKKVTVKGWNPETKELIVGTQPAPPSKLGSKGAVAAAGSLAADETFTVDHPIWTKEEADVLAKGRVRELNLSFITGEAECQGSEKGDLGEVCKITANKAKADDPFNGKYYIMGITHRYSLNTKDEGPFTTIYKLARDGQGG